MTRRHQPPPPPAPPPGYVWFYWRLIPIEEVERRARQRMGDHDNRQRATRDQDNGDDITGPARRRGPEMKAKRVATAPAAGTMMEVRQ
jgi:hypothetical protein